ncbi:MAG: L-2-amino-thiazoline-4-carboxylic acid hydrolase [Negativicutes bacterium]|nr:L-2-amino-thiazoline-4-carboxylic acid hydrolase [Negativicutes bacterium]
MSVEKEKQEIKDFVDSLKLEQAVTAEQYRVAMKGAIKDRAIIYYCIWKKIRELYPGIDAARIMKEASWDFGIIKGNQLAHKIGGVDKSPREVLKGQTSKGGMLVFRQEIVELNDEKAVKIFNECPHLEAFEELGAAPEELRLLCRDMLCWGDYGTFAPFADIKLEWPSTIADGTDKGCAMTITGVDPKI